MNQPTNSQPANAQLPTEPAALLHGILDVSPGYIAYCEPVYQPENGKTGAIVDFTYRVVNARMAQLMGQPAERLTGQLMSSFAKTFHLKRDVFEQYVAALQNRRAATFELRHVRNKQEIWLRISVEPLMQGIVISAVDVTTDRQHRLQLESLNRVLQQSNESLQSFAYVASHDLQEPLRRIQSFSDILQNQFQDNLSDGERDMAVRIQRSAHRMQQLIRDLLTYSQVTTQRDLNKLISLDRVVDDVVSDLEMSIAEQNARLHVAPLPVVRGSASLLRQLMQNLITNALKFRRPDEPIRLEIGCRRAELAELPVVLPDTLPYWLIAVTDNGLGFDEKYKSRIFQPFQQLLNKKTYGGTGIGLAICQRVAESHGGAIDVISQPGQGTTFLVFLPVCEESGQAADA